MSRRPDQPDVDEAYAVQSPDDNVRLYRRWASSYDEDFVERTNYAQYQDVADMLARIQHDLNAPVLDVGCGTGIVGSALCERGFTAIDGIDISAEMLEVAATRMTDKGEAVYRQLMTADLTQTVDIDSNSYGSIVSAGTFTHGHLGPDALNELLRVAVPGGWIVITVRSTHFNAAGFAAKLANDEERGVISKLELTEINVYAPGSPDDKHAQDTAMLVLCRVN